MRIAVPTLITAVVTSALAVVINLATDWKGNSWAWLAVVVLTLLSAGASYWLSRSSEEPTALISRSVTGKVSKSTIITGDHNDVR